MSESAPSSRAGKDILGTLAILSEQIIALLEACEGMREDEIIQWASERAKDRVLQRDEGICRLRDNGSSLRQIAHVTGLTHAGVAQVLRRHGKC